MSRWRINPFPWSDSFEISVSRIRGWAVLFANFITSLYEIIDNFEHLHPFFSRYRSVHAKSRAKLDTSDCFWHFSIKIDLYIRITQFPNQISASSFIRCKCNRVVKITSKLILIFIRAQFHQYRKFSNQIHRECDILLAKLILIFVQTLCNY